MTTNRTSLGTLSVDSISSNSGDLVITSSSTSVSFSGKTLINIGGGVITSITAGTGISSTGGATPTISVATTAVTPASYTFTSLTVDSTGRLTAASSGSAYTTNANTGFGLSTASSSLGSSNTFIGYSAGSSGSGTPSSVVVVGANSSTANGSNSVIVGAGSTVAGSAPMTIIGQGITAGSAFDSDFIGRGVKTGNAGNQVIIGDTAGSTNNAGQYDTIVGYGGGANLTEAQVGGQGDNVLLGALTQNTSAFGASSTLGGCVVIGSQAGITGTRLSTTVVGCFATSTSSNAIVIGNSASSSTFSGGITIGTGAIARENNTLALGAVAPGNLAVSTAAGAGTASALPALPQGYLVIFLNNDGTRYKIPFYKNV